MATNDFANSWKSSTQARKQRKYRYNAPLHIKQKLVHSHLSPDLRKKYLTRSIQVKVGDKVKIMRGQYSRKEGKVEKVELKNTRVYVTGVESLKKDGSKAIVPLNPSNLMIVELNLDDKKRKSKLENKPSSSKKEEPKEKPKEKTKEQTNNEDKSSSDTIKQ